jgi:8-oxo-dGTP pyrophosphatase MutT (NUDIX family)
MNDSYCNNCGKQGHLYHHCKMPITSIGLITFRIRNDEIQYLMICRKDTLGYIDFMRGKYSIFNKDYILNMLKQMTNEEKNRLKTLTFEELWIGLWGSKSVSSQYKSEESISYEKINSLRNGITTKNDFYNLNLLIEESNQYQLWKEPEWGFPKGRRNYQEKDFECALREFNEETGYNTKNIMTFQNVYPFEEIFTGSNYKSYKHKYYLAYMKYNNTLVIDKFQKSEVSKMEWKNYDDCITAIRPYNLEKIRMLNNINHILKTLRIFST